MTLVLGDGTVASSGGKVVKNVAGYDLGKLVCGSEGRLALIARVSLRLHPLPAAAATLVVETGDPARRRHDAPTLAAPTQRARRAAAGSGRGPLRGPRPIRRGPARDGPLARRRRFCGRRRLGRGARAPGASARSDAVRPRRTRERPLDPRRGGGPPRRGNRLRPAPGRRRPLEGDTERPTARSRHGSTPGAFSRDRGAHPGLRPLRLLPPDLPHLRPLGRGDGLSARSHPADGEDGTGNAPARPDRCRALRPLPRMHGLREQLPVGRPVRQVDRGDTRHGRGATRSAPVRTSPAASALRDPPHPRRMRLALRLAPLGRRLPSPAWARPMLDLAPQWRSTEQPAAFTPVSNRHRRPAAWAF